MTGNEMLNLKIDGKEVRAEKGTLLSELSDKYKNTEDDILLAIVGHRLCELFKPVTEDCEIRFLTGRHKDGKLAYRRSLIFLMQKALDDLVKDGEFGSDAKNTGEDLSKIPDIHVMFSLGNGYFCMSDGDFEVTEDFLSKLSKKMKEIVEKDIKIEKKPVHTRKARAIFRDHGMLSKDALLKYRNSSYTNIYEIEDTNDYFYGYMVPRTGVLGHFRLEKYKDGFMLLFPTKDPKAVEEFSPYEKLYTVLRQSADWSSLLKIRTVGALNDAIVEGRAQEIIAMQEALMEEKIGSLARAIAKERDRRFVMIAGPSSSGKTTFSHRLSVQLRALGLTPHPFPLDDYYNDHDNMPVDEFGEVDFEALECLDVELFNMDMALLMRGDEVKLPTFNFKTGRREYKGRSMKLQKGDVLVIEGIHGLNDKLSYSLPKESKYRIYISALTQLAIDEHNPLSTTDGRLIRRIVRDARTRGTCAKDTIAMWDSVHRGEEKNIFPFQDMADAFFNSALIYEMAIMRIYAMPELFSVPRECEEYREAKRLMKLLDYFLPLPTEDIPKNSLIREFVGGSSFLV